MIYRLNREQWVPAPGDDVFAFFSDARNLAVLTPPWLRFHILDSGPGELAEGALIRYQLGWHGISIGWTTKITRWDPPREFADLQLRGPYQLWHHSHRFEAADGGTNIIDAVHYSLPFGWLGRIAHKLAVRRDIEKIFDYRYQRIKERFGVAE